MYIPSIGDKVSCKSMLFSGPGVVNYIDDPNLFNHYTSPIQVRLDTPDEHGHHIKRFSIKEIKLIGGI